MTGKKCKIISAKPIRHIECECGFSGTAVGGTCPNCNATEMMDDSQKSALDVHRATLNAPPKGRDLPEGWTHSMQVGHAHPSVQASLAEYEQASQSKQGGADAS